MYLFLYCTAVCVRIIQAGYDSLIGEVIVHLHSTNITGNLGEFLEIDPDGGWKEYRFGEFLGIPYAESPTGELRFRYPVPYDISRQRNFRATQFGPACIQLNDETFKDPILYSNKIRQGAEMWNSRSISEDCLTINVWTPYPVRRKDELLPVMVWIYGGGFHSGSSQLDVYRGHRLSSLENVVVVSFNYRLGVFGFLYLDDTHAPGNLGLYDQLAALRWVNSSIRSFGGDPTRVTIFGESAGAASVGHHLLSDLSAGLFHRAIMQSGSPTAPWAVLPRAEMLHRSMSVAQHLNCAHPDTARVVNCIKHAPAEKLSMAEAVLWRYPTDRFLPLPVGPIVDGKIIRDHPLDTLKKGNFKVVPLVIGSNLNEGSIFLPYYLPHLFNVNEDSVISSSQYNAAMTSSFGHLPAPLLEQVKSLYRNWSDPTDGVSNRRAMDRVLGDDNIVCPCNEFARYFSLAGSRVYMYQLSHRASTETWPEWMGVIHGADCQWVFGQFLDQAVTAQEKALNRRILRYWANFAHTSNPNRRWLTVFEQEHWARWTLHNQLFSPLNTSYPTSVPGGPRARQCAFWNLYHPTAVQYYTRNKCPSNGPPLHNLANLRQQLKDSQSGMLAPSILALLSCFLTTNSNCS